MDDITISLQINFQRHLYSFQATFKACFSLYIKHLSNQKICITVQKFGVCKKFLFSN